MIMLLVRSLGIMEVEFTQSVAWESNRLAQWNLNVMSGNSGLICRIRENKGVRCGNSLARG
jgi:hypothetical protein